MRKNINILGRLTKIKYSLVLVAILGSWSCKTIDSSSQNFQASDSAQPKGSFEPQYCGLNSIKNHDILSICLGNIAGEESGGVKTFTSALVETRSSKKIYHIDSGYFRGDDMNFEIDFEGKRTSGQIKIKDWKTLIPRSAVFAGARIDGFDSADKSTNVLHWRASEISDDIANLLSTFLEIKGLKTRAQDFRAMDPNALVTVTYFTVRIYSHFSIQYAGKLGDVGPIIRSTLSRYEFVGEVQDGKYGLHENKFIDGNLKTDIVSTSFRNLVPLNQNRMQAFLEFSGYAERGVSPLRTVDRDAFSVDFFDYKGVRYDYISTVKSAHKIGGLFAQGSTKLVGWLVDGRIALIDYVNFDPDL